MIHQLKVTAVTENTAGCFEALGEWGLSLWIEADGHRLLCDTGKGQALGFNAKLLGIDLTKADTMAGLVEAIIRHENGQQPYTREVILAGVGMGLGSA